VDVLEIGARVKVLVPFVHTFDTEYTVTGQHMEDGVVVAYELNGFGHFHRMYLERI